MIRKPNNSLPYFLVVIILLTAFFMWGCSSAGKEDSEQDGLDERALLPSLEQVLPNDQYLFLPLENVGFRLTFMGPVDPAVVEQAVSFEPELDFAVRNEGYGPGEIYLDPQEKLQSDTSYILRIKDVQNESTGKPETLQFAYRTEFRGDWRVAEPQWSHDGEEIAYLVQPAGSDTAELWKVDIGDGSEQLLADGAAWPGRIDWSPDDSVILYTKMIYLPDKNYSIPEVRTVDRDGREEKIIVSAEELAGIASFGPINTYPWWSPDGKRIALQLDLGGEDAHSDLHRSMALVNSDGTDLTAVAGQIFVGWQGAEVAGLENSPEL